MHTFDEQFSLDDEALIDIEPYEGLPDFPGPLGGDDDEQDDDTDVPVGLAFMARALDSTRHWEEALNWYRNHTTESAIGFDPDRACLKICRTARNVPAKYLTAKECQDAVPEANRVYAVRDLRRGMVAFFDNPGDSNVAGHIVTIIGRVKGFDPDSLHDVLCVTNSVQSGHLTVVRADYFEEHWGDPFKFGATWINGVEIDHPGPKGSKVERFNEGGPVYDLNLLHKAGKDRPKPRMVLDRIETQIKSLPDNPKLVRVRQFKDEWKKERVIDLSLLDAAVREGRVGVVKRVRDEIKRLIETLPDE